MNKTQFVEILNNPNLVSEKTLSEIKEIIDEYPFFQIGRMLLLKNLHKLDNIRYNSELKQSAVYIADRNKLYSLINNIQKYNDVGDLEAQEENKNSSPESIEPKKEDINTKNKQTVTVTDNYLNASDEYSSDQGHVYNFSNKETTEPSQKANDYELQNIILPAADLLDYEISTTTGYSLPKLDEIENINADKNKSFSEWLYIMRYSSSAKEPEKKKELPRGLDLINNFLNSNPKIITPPPTKTKVKEIDLSEAETGSPEDILSETLADIYIKQGHKSKAISIFEKLLLKYPEKNVYFAQRICDLKEN